MRLFLTLAIGLFFLLGGMYLLRQALQRLAGTRLRRGILWMTLTPWRAFFSGTVATALIQSSSVLTVMTVSFVDAGLLPFANALYLILGSNIGTTVTTQLLAFPIDQFSYSAMLLGSLGFLSLNNRWRYLALALLGLGLLFFGLMTLQTGLEPLAAQPGLQRFLHSLGDHHLHGVAAGALLSAVLHSSSATTGIVMLLTEEGWITLPTAIAFVLGANIGTCVTAVLASLASNKAARRVAYFHILLNLFGVLVFLPVLYPFTRLVTFLGGDLARQVANAHTFFNLISSVLAFSFIPTATRLLKRM